MLHLHNKLCEKSALYRRWHDHPSHPVVHWTLFLLACGLFTWSFMSGVRTGYGQTPPTGGSTPQPHPTSNGRIVGALPDHILVKFKDGVLDAQQTDVLGRHGMKEKSRIGDIDVRLIAIPAGKAPADAAAELKGAEAGSVAFAEPDAIIAPSLTPNDPWYANWQSDKRQAQGPAAWDATTGSASQVLAIADTGVDCTHEDLAANCVPGWNFFDGTSDTSDVYGHGTSVAGVAAAIGNNGVGIAGMTWKSKIMPLRVSAPDGTASLSTIASAISYAADHGVKVVNNSYQSGGSATVRSAAQYLKSKGGLLVVSEGNYGSNTGYDNSPDVISVSAVDPNDALYSWSSFGADVDVAAPGCTGAATVNHGGYGSFCGTSNAAPEVSGTLMLLWAANPSLTPDQVQSALLSSAKDLGATGWDQSYGWGRIDASAAVAAALGTTAPPPPPPPPPPPATVTITSSQVTSTATGATFTWTTDVPSTGSVSYGTTSDVPLSATDAKQGTSHSVTVAGLARSTKYFYVIKAKTLDGSASASTAISSFRTKPK